MRALRMFATAFHSTNFDLRHPVNDSWLDRTAAAEPFTLCLLAGDPDMADVGEGDPTHLWPEDTVEYRIYPQTSPRDEDQADTLSELALECNHASRLLSASHVWHFSPFALSPSIASENRIHHRGDFVNLDIGCCS